MVNFDGHSNGTNESDTTNDPENDFPLREAFTDYSGQARNFVISFCPVPLGFAVQAQEEGKEGNGYLFREFDPTSPYLALGRLRGRIRQMLAIRHIEQRTADQFQATHQTLRGRISYSSGEVGFVIDGQFLTLQQFGKMLATFEGFEFQLDLVD